MTQLFPFIPPAKGAFQFSPTMDGETYNAFVTWNLFGNRFYVNLFSPDGSLLFCLPQIGSTVAATLQSLTWAHGYVSAITSAPHTWLPLATVPLIISGCSPDTYNGTVQAFITGPDTFEYPLAVDPGDVATYGTADFPIDIAAGYFDTSTLVYRESLKQFEVSP